MDAQQQQELVLERTRNQKLSLSLSSRVRVRLLNNKEFVLDLEHLKSEFAPKLTDLQLDVKSRLKEKVFCLKI